MSWDEKFKLDVWYVDNWSLKMDLKIILMTIRSVFKREGISAEGEATAAEFMGSGLSRKKAQKTQKSFE